LNLKPPESISDQIFKYFFEKIQHGEVSLDDRFVEWRVAKELNASRTPVREAFQRLEHEGLFERLPQGGMRLKPLTHQSINQIFGIRRILEPYAARLACENISQEDILSLKQLKAAALEVIFSETLERDIKVKELFRLNTRFHDIIYLTTKNPYLIQIITNLKSMVLQLRSLGVREDSAWQKAWNEHSMLISYFESGDAEKAAVLTREHVDNAKSDVIARADEYVVDS
jgi:DNA-binding GntR family transcriptional regulator